MKSSYDILKEIESLIEQDSSDNATEQEQNAKDFLDKIDSDSRLTKQKDKSSNKKSKQQKLADKREKSKKQKAEDSPAEDGESIVDFSKSDKGDELADDSKNPEKISHQKAVKDVQYHIDNYNELRSAPTLNDYKDEIKTYFSRLTEDEKLIAYVINKAIVEITLNEISAKNTLLPKNVSIQQKKEPEAKSNNSSNINQSVESKSKQQKQSDSPIVVGEGVEQDKSDFYLILENNK